MADLDLIRSRLSCIDVAQRLGIDIPRKGDAQCPRHKGKSLRVKEDYFKCHGGCADEGGKGDIFSLVMFATECNFQEALEQCAAWAGVQLDNSPAAQEKTKRRRAVEDALTFAASFYAEHYTPDSPAYRYADARGLHNDEAQLGYAPDSWDTLSKALTENGVDLAVAEDAGLIARRSNGRGYYDVLRHRLIVPAFQHGRCIYLQGRALGTDETSKALNIAPATTEDHAPKYKNAALADPPLYSVNGALSHERPVLSESTSDVLRLTNAAHLPAIGTYGTSLQDRHINRLKRFDVLYAAIHNDDAGNKFADALARGLGERIRIVPPPNNLKDWDEAFTQGQSWQVDDRLTWLRWKLTQIEPGDDPLSIRPKLEPLFAYLAALDDESLVVTYLEEMRVYFSWKRDLHQSYARRVRDLRAKLQQEQRSDDADVAEESLVIGETLEPPIFISPALAEHNGVVYVAQMMTFQSSKTTKKHGTVTVPVYLPVVLNSERRRLVPEPPPEGAPDGALTYLDRSLNLALRGGLPEAAEGRWSYRSMVDFLNGNASMVKAHEVFEALLSNLKRYVYHADETSYVVDVLWAMGTYFHQLWNAFPYLALHGHPGAGKTTLLTWLAATCFNARFLVNTSEASLYRSIQAQAPTLLIDEQEGLNSSKAAKESKADLMGLLKSGYKRGAMAARQRLDRPDITEYFEVYSPKALAAIEHFEDVLENRAILTFMNRKPSGIDLAESDEILNQDGTTFAALRDQLYLLLMQEAPNVRKITERVSFAAENRFRELFKPLFAMAALVDLSRADGERTVLDMLEQASAAKLKVRSERDNLAPEAQLRETLKLLVENANDEDEDYEVGTITADGLVLVDTIQIKKVFESLFSSRDQSFYNDQWLGKQVQKTPGITSATPRRRRRMVQELDRQTNEMKWVEKQVICYLLDPSVYKEPKETL